MKEGLNIITEGSMEIFIISANIQKKCIIEKGKRKKQFQHIDEKEEILYNKSV